MKINICIDYQGYYISTSDETSGAGTDKTTVKTQVQGKDKAEAVQKSLKLVELARKSLDEIESKLKAH